MMGSLSLWHWVLVLLLVTGLVAIVVFANRRSQRTADGPIGIGGWLILPIIGFAGTIVLTTINLVAALRDYEGLYFIFSDDTGAFDYLIWAVLASFLAGIAVVVSASVCLFKIFVSKKRLRAIAVTHYVFLAVAGLVDLWGDDVFSSVFPDEPRDPAAAREAVRGVFAALIWIPYFLVSRRVRNTFEVTPGSLTAAKPSSEKVAG